MNYTYIEIIKTATNEVVSRMDVTGKSERFIEQVEAGASINLNHNEYHLDRNESEVELPKIDK